MAFRKTSGDAAPIQTPKKTSNLVNEHTTTSNGIRTMKISRSSVVVPPENGEKKPTQSTAESQQEDGQAVLQDTQSAPAEQMSAFQTVVITIALCLCVFLAALDVTIITTALPTIAEHFHSIAGYTWVGAAYTLAEAASTPIWGKLSDIWGRKPLLQFAIAVFFTGSLLSALSVNIGMLIVGRAIQGIGGGGLLTIVNIVIGDLFSMRDRGKYYGFTGMTWGVAASVGPIVGGVLTEKVSWRWCFYINLPIIGVVFIIILLFLRLETPKTPVWAGLKAVDWLGSVTIIGSTVMLLLGLEFGGVVHPWRSAIVLCLIIFGVLTGGIFVLIEWKIARYPVIPLRLFKSLSNTASLSACFVHGVILVLCTFYLPLYFQSVLGATPLLSGVWLVPVCTGMALAATATGICIKITGRYLELVWAGFALTTLGAGLLIDLDVDKNWPKIIIYQIIIGFGIGPNFQALLIATQNGVSTHDVATATAMFGFVRNLASSIGVVIGGVIFQNGIQSHATELRDSLGSAAELLLGGAATASTGIVNNLPEDQAIVARHTYFESLKNVWIFAVAISTVGLLACVAIRKTTLSQENVLVKTGLDAEEQRRTAFLTKENRDLGDKETEKV